MRYPRLSANAKLTIGYSGTAVVCTGNGWDNLTVSKRQRGVDQVKSASRRIREKAAGPSVSLIEQVAKARVQWEQAELGKEKQKALSALRLLEIRAGIRDRQGKTVTLDYMPETWSGGQD